MTNVRTNIAHGLVLNAAGTFIDPADDASADGGTAIDRYAQNARSGKYMSALLFAKVGAATGSPTAQSVTVTVQDSADGSTDWTAIGSANVHGASASGSGLAAITADNGAAYCEINLKHVRRYVRVLVTTAFTGGTSPTISVCAGLVFVENEA